MLLVVGGAELSPVAAAAGEGVEGALRSEAYLRSVADVEPEGHDSHFLSLNELLVIFVSFYGTPSRFVFFHCHVTPWCPAPPPDSSCGDL